MSNRSIYTILFELVGLLLAILVSLVVIWPFILYKVDFPFIKFNFILVFISITFVRWQFFIKFSFFKDSLILHGFLFIAAIIAIIGFYGTYGDFKLFIQEVSLSSLFGHLNFKEAVWIREYLKNEFSFFSVFGIISSALFIIKLIKSVFRIVNKR